MAGMKRFVTYIYSYEDRKKSSNVGFAKIEIRGEQGRIEIHLRGIYPGRMNTKVYLFVEDAGDMVGILLGEMGIQNGNGDFSAAFKVDNVGGTSINFFTMEGIVLIGEGQRIFMSRWKEGKPLEVCANRFRVWEMENIEPPVETADVENTSMESEEENIAATEVPMRNIFPRYDWREIWERLMQNHEELSLGEDGEISLVKIELKDIRELPRRYWYLGNNSFLLHGFFNYRYLVIGKIEEDRWIMGVPGIYQNQERVMAVIFGFPEFLPEPVENRFGYWYRVLEE